MKLTLLLLAALFSVSAFAGICTFENTTPETKLSPLLVSALEELGCHEAPESQRAPNHLLISVIGYDDKDKEIVGVNAAIVNRLNGRMISKQQKSGIATNLHVAWRTFGHQSDYDRARAKINHQAMRELARELSSGWLIQ